MKKKVYVLYGGKSAEHEVSIDSALNVLNELNKNRYDVFAVYITQEGIWTKPFRVEKKEIKKEQLVKESNLELRLSLSQFFQNDFTNNSIIFPVLHGTFGEDGKLQGLLEMLDLPYVGNGVLSAVVGMDKVISKQIFAMHDIPQTAYKYFTKEQFLKDRGSYLSCVKKEIGFPCYVKPANMGSSVGISYCREELDLAQAIATAFLYDDKVLIEKEVVGKEVIVGVTGNGDQLKCSLAGEWKRGQQFFDYEDKYLDENLTPLIPAHIHKETYEQICHYAKLAYTSLDGAGLMRIDFFVTNNQRIYLNEVNTLPGFTKYSMFPVLIESTDGLSYSALLDRLIQLGFNSYEKRNRLHFRRVSK